MFLLRHSPSFSGFNFGALFSPDPSSCDHLASPSQAPSIAWSTLHTTSHVAVQGQRAKHCHTLGRGSKRPRISTTAASVRAREQTKDNGALKIYEMKPHKNCASCKPPICAPCARALVGDKQVPGGAPSALVELVGLYPVLSPDRSRGFARGRLCLASSERSRQNPPTPMCGSRKPESGHACVVVNAFITRAEQRYVRLLSLLLWPMVKGPMNYVSQRPL